METTIIFEMAIGNYHDKFIKECNLLSDRGFTVSPVQPKIKDNSNCYNYELLFQK